MIRETENPVIKMFGKVLDEIFSRAIRGQCEYEQDINQLQSLLLKVRKLKAEGLELKILNIIAVVNSVSGKFYEVEAQFRMLYDRYTAVNDLDGMVTSLNNQAVTLDALGKYEDSLQVYNEGMQVITTAPPPHYRIASYGLLLTGRMGLLLIFDRLEEAEQTFQVIDQCAEEFVEFNRDEYSRTKMYGYHHSAEIALQRGKINEALTNYNLAIELARGGDMRLEIGMIEFTRAHIEAVRNDPVSATEYWQKGIDLVESLNIPALSGIQFLAEARYLRRKGILQEADHFVHRALTLFEQHNIQQGQAIIHEQWQI